ncbi:MAG: hypothetical protein AMJ84_14190 [Acidithiobacillales bacterium SM23_46]|nr:MAG: hypothetical protein AMJ84_14190 [Acidithiobacillales bacterium SM23_46]
MGLRFGAEALQMVGMAAHIGRQDLERNDALQFRIVRLVDDTHAAVAEALQQGVAAESVTRRKARRGFTGMRARGISAPLRKAMRKYHRARNCVELVSFHDPAPHNDKIRQETACCCPLNYSGWDLGLRPGDGFSTSVAARRMGGECRDFVADRLEGQSRLEK